MKSRKSGKKLYSELTASRNNYLTRAQEASSLTIPQLYPSSTDASSIIDGDSYANPYQSLGARGVNNLANKIILTLFPPATAFFKMGISPITLKNMNRGEGEINQALQTLEKSIVNEMEISQLRSVLVELIKQGIVGGSALLYVPVDEKPRAISMDRFGIKRSKSKEVLQICIKESLYYTELSNSIKEQLKGSLELTDKHLNNEKPLDVYTIVQRLDSEMFSVEQDIFGIVLDGTKGTYKKKDLPYVFVPFVDRGENYGRSYIEDYIGDIKSYEGLRKSVLEAAAESARILYLVSPNAILTPKKLESASSGDVLLGSINDVGVLQADKRLDLQIAQQEMEILRLDLSTLFLLDSSVRRNAERVTAEEIRRVSQELEVALGGIYSTLANVLQEPLVNLYLARMRSKGLINNALSDSIELEVTTGSAALGRGTEFNAISTFIGTLQNTLGQEFYKFIKMPEMIARVANSLDISTSELVKTEEELQADAQAQQQAQLEQQAVAPAINGVAKQQQQG